MSQGGDVVGQGGQRGESGYDNVRRMSLAGHNGGRQLGEARAREVGCLGASTQHTTRDTDTRHTWQAFTTSVGPVVSCSTGGVHTQADVQVGGYGMCEGVHTIATGGCVAEPLVWFDFQVRWFRPTRSAVRWLVLQGG